MIRLKDQNKLRLDLYDHDYVKWEHEDTEYCFHARYDDWSDSPREYCDQIDMMMCWHSRYSLGDKNLYKEPVDFWQAMVRKHVPDEEVFKAVAAGELYGIRIVPSEDQPGCYDIYETCYLAGWQTSEEAKEYLEYADVPSEDVPYYLSDDLSIGHCQFLLEPYMEWMDLWLYDHSGITMSCSRGGNPFTCPWDSGQVGWIVALKETILKETGATEENWREKAVEVMEGSVDLYDKYIMGYSFVYTLYEKGDDGEWFESDNIGGFYGTDIVENGAIEYTGPGLEEALASGDYEEGEGRGDIEEWFDAG